MKRFLSISFLVLLSILIAPTVTTKFDASAGRTAVGAGLGEYCPCGVSGPACYEESTGERCDCAGSPNPPVECSAGRATSPDYGSAILIGIAVLYLLKRFI